MDDLAFLQYLLTLALSALVPVGLLLVYVAGEPYARAWRMALNGLVIMGLAGIGYWAVGFAFQFGGVGLVYLRPDLLGLVWEWSALPADWGTGWGMLGLSGWFLRGDGITATAYALFLAHLPWALTAALLPGMALARRTPAPVTWAVGLVTGGLIYPVAGNWVQGGGWLAALGRNLELGHGFVDFAGAGTVFLVGGLVAVAGLLVWHDPSAHPIPGEPDPPTVHYPLMVLLGGLLVLIGALGWVWSNPLYLDLLDEAATLRAGVNVVLAGLSGAVLPGLYGWFVRGESPPAFLARGVTAGVVAALAVGPFVPSGVAVGLGLTAGACVPFVTYLVQQMARLEDDGGVVSTTILPAVIGLLAVAFFADGQYGAGWNQVGADNYLGVAGQGVSGLWVAGGFQADLLGQFQAQLIGVLALAIWGFSLGSLVCVPLGLLIHAFGEEPVPSSFPTSAPAPAAAPGSFPTEAAGYPESTPGDYPRPAPSASGGVHSSAEVSGSPPSPRG